MKRVKSLGDKEEKEKLIVGIFREQLRLQMLSPSETTYALGIVSYYEARGRLTDGQLSASWRMMLRTIQTREPDLDRFIF